MADESEARLRARRAHPAGKGRRTLSAVPSGTVVPFDQFAPEQSVEEAVVAVEPVSEAPLRLTRRGRALLRAAVALLVAVAVIGGVLLVGRQAQAGEQSRPLPVTYRVVLPGETLWTIAGKVAPGADRRDTVDRIIDLNALPGAAVTAGQRIAVPVTAP